MDMHSVTYTVTRTIRTKTKPIKEPSFGFYMAADRLRAPETVQPPSTTKLILDAIRRVALERSYEPGERQWMLCAFPDQKAPHNEAITLYLNQTIARLQRMQVRFDAKI